MAEPFHVFLSFRGEVRNNFTCYLYQALKADGFEPFMDRAAMGAGDELRSSIEDAIKNSMSAIIIFSENYAFSTWCLNELILILERKRTCPGYFIIPILYEVRSADVKHQLGKFGEALEKHKKRYENQQVDKWREALQEVGGIIALRVDGMLTEFIPKVVELFGNRFYKQFSGGSPHITFPPEKVDQPIQHVQTTPSDSIDPLNEYPQICLPGDGDKVVLYFSGSSPVWCNMVKKFLKEYDVDFEVRDEDQLNHFRKPLDGIELFVSGRSLGGLRSVQELYKNGKLGEILKYHKQLQESTSRDDGMDHHSFLSEWSDYII